MAFNENPLSLSLSETAFEAWLRDNGHLETIDRTGLDHHLRFPTQSSFKELSKAVKSNPFMTLTRKLSDCRSLFRLLLDAVIFEKECFIRLGIFHKIDLPRVIFALSLIYGKRWACCACHA